VTIELYELAKVHVQATKLFILACDILHSFSNSYLDITLVAGPISLNFYLFSLSSQVVESLFQSERVLLVVEKIEVMLASTPRVAVRSTRALRAVRTPRRLNARFQSTSTPQPATNSGSSHVVAGLAGGSLVFLAGYGYYHFSGAKTIVNTIHSTKSTFESAFKKSTEKAPAPNEAIQWLKDTVSGYTKIIPGSQSYVDSAFNDLETIHKQHGPEVEAIIKETYDDLKDVTKAGASWEAATQAYSVLQKALTKISGLAKDAAGDIIENHPQLKEKLGPKYQQLKQMGEQYGPEAQKQIDETWSKVQDIVKSGPLKPDTYTKIQDLVSETTEKVKQFGNQAWSKGMEEAKPLLDKNPEVKEFVDKNKDALMQGDLSQLWSRIQEYAKSGNTDDAMKFLKEQVDNVQNKASSSSSGAVASLAGLFGGIPGAGELGDKMKQLQELYQKRGKEAEDLVKSAVDDIKKVLDKKVQEGQNLKEKAEKDVKK
jgi:hypothetical protein